MLGQVLQAIVSPRIPVASARGVSNSVSITEICLKPATNNNMKPIAGLSPCDLSCDGFDQTIAINYGDDIGAIAQVGKQHH